METPVSIPAVESGATRNSNTTLHHLLTEDLPGCQTAATPVAEANNASSCTQNNNNTSNKNINKNSRKDAEQEEVTAMDVSEQEVTSDSTCASSSCSGNSCLSTNFQLRTGLGQSAFHSIGGASNQRGTTTSHRNLRDRSNRKPIQERPRQKRQTLQDMTKPLKIWLYHHRDNPYPSKSEKVQLTESSHMTMTQVSNWFANARRRLKNTVRDPELTWAKRIKLYNNYVEGNQELLSVGSSSSSSSDDELHEEQESSQPGKDNKQQPAASIQDPAAEQCQISDDSALVNQTQNEDKDLPVRLSANTHSSTQFHSLSLHKKNSPVHEAEPMDTVVQSVAESCTSGTPQVVADVQKQQSAPTQAAAEECQSVYVVPPVGTIGGFADVESSLDGNETAPKYKTNIMQRYLNDSYQSALQSLHSLGNRDLKESERHRNPSGSLSSHDYEEYMSSASSARSTPTREHQDGHLDEYEEFSKIWPDIKSRAEDDLYWKEISAALALTSLARSRYSTQTH